MEKLFLSVLNMSLTASFVIAAIILVRLPLKKAPKIISYALWAVVGFRLVFPFSLESAFSLLPFNPSPIPQDIALQAVPQLDSGITVVDYVVSSSLPHAVPYASVNPLQIWLFVGAYIWLLGIAIMLTYSFVSILLLKRRLCGAALIEDNLYEADNLKTPFVIGHFRPKIYIPSGLTEGERQYIVLHEQTHIRRCDHGIKMLAYFILSVHWFNPFVWAAFILMSADMEMSCDERVIRRLGGEIKSEYSMSLVRVAAGRRILNGSPLAFGEGGVTKRVKNVLSLKKPSRLVIAAAVTVVAVLSAGFALNRPKAADEMLADVAFGTFVLENVTERQSFERMTSFTLYGEGVATFEPARISSYILPNCTFDVEDGELVFRAIVGTEQNEAFFGVADNQVIARFSVIDRNTLVFLSSEIPLFAEPDGWYVLDDGLPLKQFSNYNLFTIASLKTSYVGNNSAVGEIIRALPSLDGEHTQRFFSIGDDYGTGAAPYTVTLYYEPNSAETGDERNLTLAPKNAALLFALIENLEEVNCAFRKTPGGSELEKEAYTSSVRFNRDDVTIHLESMGLTWEDFAEDWNSSVEKLFAFGNAVSDEGLSENTVVIESEGGAVYEAVSEAVSETIPNFTDLGTETDMIAEPKITDGSIIRIVDFEMGDTCSLYAEVLVPTGETDESSGAIKYEVVRNTKLLLPADVFVNYIDYDSSTGRNGKKLISYLAHGGSYFTESTIAKLAVHTDEGRNAITELTELYEP